jgi:ferredoxin-NADP reductase
MSAKIEARILDVTVSEIIDFGNETRHFDLRFDAGVEMTFLPGQFVAVLCPHNGKTIRRAYSIASPSYDKTGVGLVIKRVDGGAVTNWFWGLRQGDRFQVHGPYGKFVLPESIDFEPVFVATGTGIAPFRSMILSLLKGGHPGKLSLVFGVRFENAIPYHAEFTDLAARHPNFKYILTVSRPTPAWKGETGYVQTKIPTLFAQPAGRRIYICGLGEMIKAVGEAAAQCGYAKEQILFEKYD